MNSMVVGYKLLDSDGLTISQWGGVWGQCPNIPNPLLLPNGIQICGITNAGPVRDGYTIEEWIMDEPLIVPQSITRRQCALMLHKTGLITLEDALHMTKNANVPTAIGHLFANLAPPDQIMAEIDFAAINYYRDNPLIVDLMKSSGFTEEQTDGFFIAAAQL